MAFTREDAEKKCVVLGKNGQYLEVKWRIVWFRENCPNGIIETEMIHFDPDRKGECEITEWIDNPKVPGKKMPVKKMKEAFGMTVFRATISDGNGGKATATKSENAASFEDYIEKAETGAIGRALALLGYGTQFTGDELAEHHRIVDAPVSNGDNATPRTQHPRTSEPAKSANQRPAATPRTFQPVSAQPASQRVDAPPIERIISSANRTFADGGYASLKATVSAKHELGDISDGDIPASIRLEMADMIRAEATQRKAS